MTRRWNISLKVALPLALSVVSLLAASTLPTDCNRAFALSDEGSSNQGTLGSWIYHKALQVFRKADVVHYEHQGGDETIEQVSMNGDKCQALCDCSGYVSYVIKTVAPKHYEALKDSSSLSGHPLASTYARFFASLSSEPHDGWQRIPNYSELRQGDLIAWEKSVNPDAPVGKKKGNTGHVMIVESPASLPEHVRSKNEGEKIRFVSVPVIDSSSVDHFPPEELPPRAHQEHRDGVGRGVVRLILDDRDRVIGYWEGTYWGEGGKNITKPSYTDSVAFARMLHNIHPGMNPGSPGATSDTSGRNDEP